MNLWQIDRAILDCVDLETGEVIDIEALAALSMERETKLENIALYIKNLDREAAAIREEEKALAERRKAKENKSARLKAYLAESLGGEKFETARCSISYRKSSALEVEDTTAVAEWLDNNGYVDLVVYAAPTIDKREVTKLVKGGTVIPGVELVERQSMQVK